MPTLTGTHVKFVKVPTKQEYLDYSDKDGALIFVESERKIYVDEIAYGFSDSDVANKFLKLTGDTMSGNIDMDGNEIHGVDFISFLDNTISITPQSQEGGMLFNVGTSGKTLLTLGGNDKIEFHADEITGIPTPTSLSSPSSPISKGYLETNVINKIGANNGIASLDGTGKVPSGQLPSYVDDVEEYSNKASFPETGESGKLYIDLSNNYVWRWSGSAYVNVSDGNAHLTLGTTSSTAYFGDKGKTAYDHSQLESGNPHKVTKSEVGLGSVLNYGVASKSDAETELTDIDNKYMTPLRTRQAIAKLAPKLSWEVV